MPAARIPAAAGSSCLPRVTLNLLTDFGRCLRSSLLPPQTADALSFCQFSTFQLPRDQVPDRGKPFSRRGGAMAGRGLTDVMTEERLSDLP